MLGAFSYALKGVHALSDWLDLYNKQVPIEEAKYIVFIHFVDCAMEGYANLEDAQEALESRKTDDRFGSFRHYLAEIKQSIYVERD